MMWAPARNAAPASSAMLSANLGPAEAEVTALEQERDAINDALPNLVGSPADSVAAQTRLAEIDALLPVKRRTVEAIRNAIPEAEMRERRDAIIAEVEAAMRASAKLQRNLEARYTKAAEAYAEVCREIQADKDRLRSLRARSDTVSPRVAVNCRTAEMALRYDKFASPSHGLKSVTEDLIVRGWNGAILFESR